MYLFPYYFDALALPPRFDFGSLQNGSPLLLFPARFLFFSTSASLTLARGWRTLIPRSSVVGRLSTATAVVHLFLFAPFS